MTALPSSMDNHTSSGKEANESTHKRPALMKLIESIDYLIKEPRQLIIHPSNDDDDDVDSEDQAGTSSGKTLGDAGLSINQASRVEPEARTSHLPGHRWAGGTHRIVVRPTSAAGSKCEAQLALLDQRSVEEKSAK